MATNPYFTQLHTQRFSFIGSPQQRDGTYQKDQRFLNMYPELIKSPITDGKKYYLKKRPGVSSFINLPTGTANGLFYWEANGQFYAVVGGFVYANGVNIGAVSNPSVTVGFCEVRTDSFIGLFMCDGSNAWTITVTNVVAPITDPNMPRPHIPTPVFLDGYVFLAGAASQTIYNSQLGDPDTWVSGNFIDAEMFPDSLVGLAKVQNYIAAIGQASIEWFYDNANATGSPLQRNAPAVSQFGCPAGATINQTEKELILVGSTTAGGRTIWVIDGFQPTEIANEPVREALDLEGTNIVNASAFTVQCAGHKWYVLNLAGASRTFVYDFEEQMWHEWTTSLGQQVFSYKFAVDSGTGAPVMLGINGGPLVQLSPTNYTDLGLPINCQVTTSKLDFDTVKRKRFFRLSLAADSPDGPTATTMMVYWTDDDYNTYSAGTPLTIGADYSTITQLGAARRRAFQFVFQQPFPLRMESFELDITQEVRR